jgi:nuclear pore complex protein Nup188
VRIELSFFFFYLITKNKKLEADQNKEILHLSLRLICSDEVNFLSKLAQNESDVYRPLLRIISNSLSFAKGDPKLTEKLSGELLEFFEIVVAKGTTVLLDAIQADINSPAINGRIEDMFLIISLLKGLIDTDPPAFFMAKLPNYLVDYSTLRAILNTYSNSHNLRVNDEPIFAELSLTYIIELISVDVIAERLISSGLFSTLIESPISVRIQEGNILVHTTPRLHNIWSNGLLAIILILFGKFGSRLLPEVSAFVSYFAKQVRSNTKSWSQETVAITFPALQETEQIILLQKELRKVYYEYGQASSNHLPESIEAIPGLDSAQDMSDLSNALVHLLAHPKYLTSRVIPTTLEEQQLFEGDDKIRTPLVDQLVSQIKELNESITE